MFFYVSKVFWFFFQPSNLIIIIFVFGIVLYHRGIKKSAIRIVTASVGFFALAGLSPLSYIMLLTLEEQHTKPAIEDITAPDGIIVLGGMIDPLVSTRRGEIILNDSGERLTEAARLAYRFPEAKIVISGGVGTFIYSGLDEASLAKKLFVDIGITPERILVEPNSKNTWQNAVFSKTLVKPKAGERWLLITSAYHMPRSVGVFRAAGFDVIPWPVDFRTSGMEDIWRISLWPAQGWRNVDIAAKEWVGYAAYYLTGRLK
jgi:uncharacterized SAM-binding protein YcdF (DUF218 family)